MGDDGLIEVKSVVPSTHYKNIKRQSYDPAYKWQYASHLKISNREWLDFISYCSAFPEHMQLYVYRIHKKDFAEEFKMIDERISKFRELIEKTKDTILNSDYFLGSDA